MKSVAVLNKAARDEKLLRCRRELKDLREWISDRRALQDSLMADNAALRAEVAAIKRDLAAAVDNAAPKKFTCSICLAVEPNILLRPAARTPF